MTTMDFQDSSQSLRYRTWILKVSVHCKGCQRKIKKLLRSIDGVYTASVDLQQQMVTVTGDVDTYVLMKKLGKTWRHVELLQLQDCFSGKPGKSKNKDKEAENDEDSDDDEDKKGNPNSAENAAAEGRSGVTVVKSAGIDNGGGGRVHFQVAGGNRSPAMATEPKGAANSAGAGKTGGKKKKKKKKKGNKAAATGANGAPVNTGSGGHQMGPAQVGGGKHLPMADDHSQAYVTHYTAEHRCAPTGCGPPSPYFQEFRYLRVRRTPLDVFEILSDDNPNGCRIM